MEEIIAYCKKDVEITKDLFLFGLAHGYLFFETKAGQLVRLPVEWDLFRIIPGLNRETRGQGKIETRRQGDTEGR